jgi:hypothetical protein
LFGNFSGKDKSPEALVTGTNLNKYFGLPLSDTKEEEISSNISKSQ